jgi:hypothetical protein
MACQRFFYSFLALALYLVHFVAAHAADTKVTLVPIYLEEDGSTITKRSTSAPKVHLSDDEPFWWGNPGREFCSL